MGTKHLPLSFALTLCVVSSANPARTLLECYTAALRQSELVATQKELIRQAEENYRQAIGAILPTVYGSASNQWQQPPTGIGATIFPTVQPLVKLTATQPVFQGFKEYAGLRQTGSLVSASEADKKQAETQLYLDTATNFYSILSAERDLENVNAELGLYDKRILDLKEFEKIGRSRVSEVLTAQAQRATLTAAVDQINGLVRANREVLAFLTGFESTVPLKGSHETAPRAKDVKEYLANLDKRPDVQGDTARFRAADHAITVAQSGHYPTVGLTGDYYLERVGSLKGVHWDFMVALTLPIFNGGIIQAQVHQAISKRDQAEYTVSRTKRLAIQQIRTFHSNFQFDRGQWENYQQARNLSERNYKEQTRDYRRGLVTNLDVLTALTTFQEAQRSQDRTRFAMELDFESVEAAATLRRTETAR